MTNKDEMPDVLYAAYDDQADINNRKYLAGIVEAVGDTKYHSDTSVKQMIEEAELKVAKGFALDFSKQIDKAVNDALDKACYKVFKVYKDANISLSLALDDARLLESEINSIKSKRGDV